MTDVLLLFPGVTEARFFPYLSLPVLTGYLRAQGGNIAQRDLNLALLERLASRPPEPPSETDSEYTRLLARFVAEHGPALRASMFDKVETGFPVAVAHQLVRSFIEEPLRRSLLTVRHRRLEALVEQAWSPAPSSDVPACLHEQLVAEALEEHRPRVVGISVAFFSQLGPALRIARQVRATLPEAYVILGGQQLMLRGRELARQPRIFELVDALCLGAGERTMLELMKRLDTPGGRSFTVPGALTASGEEEALPHHLGENPPPVFEGLPFHRYLADEPQLPVISCIGCYWGRCVFCSYGNRSLNGGYQQLTPAQLADHCAAGLDATRARWVMFIDENCNLRLVLKAVRLLAARGYRFWWATRNRLERELANPAFCQELADAGCRLMSVGYETNSQRVLDLMDKGVDASLYQRIIDNLHEAGIALRFSVMGGLFDETPEEAEASRAFLVANAGRIGIDVVQMLIVEPGTRLEAEPEAYGLATTAEAPLQANEQFSYLGGRVGRSYRFLSGEDWAGRSQQLSRLMDTVLPGKNADRHPRFRRGGTASAEGVAALRLHPWVVGSGPRLVDLRWALTYRLLDDLRYEPRSHSLHASTPRGRAVLERLSLADLGTVLAEETSPTVALAG